ncbi:MAG: hypothetical protein LBU44_09390 [Mediterranea sp.]|jgi:hypothetical protein|nr:hypothetical protein [Mediterranea sp.]
MKHLKVLFVTTLVLLPSFCTAQQAASILLALNEMPTEPVPFNATKKTPFIDNKSFGVNNSNNAIPDKLYYNVQLTEYDHASIDPYLSASTFRKFAIPNSSNKILVVSFGGSTDRRTDALCVVSPSGTILDTLEAAVFYYPSFGTIALKQFRIDALFNIIISRIVPTSSTSIPLDTFSSFSGYRLDTTYAINSQGRFVKQSEQCYVTKTYTRAYLEDRNKDIWNGGEYLCVTQPSIGEVLNKMSTETVPFNATKTKESIYADSHWVDNPNNVIPDKLYDNVQLTEYNHASVNPELGASTFRKFAIPNSTNKLLVIEFGGCTTWRTYVLCIVSPSGSVIDTLEAAVHLGFIALKQFRIDAQSNIIITRIVPTSSTSIPLDTFSSFSGYRLDTTYAINSQNQFVKQSEQCYVTKTYTATYLEDEDKDIWNGGETPL